MPPENRHLNADIQVLRAAAIGMAPIGELHPFHPVRRFWRLQPMAWFWVAFPLVLAELLPASGAFHTAHANYSSAFTAIFAINNLYGSLLPTVGATPSLFFPYWSLSLEEQFYLLLPVIVYVSGRQLERVLVIIVASAFLLPAVPVLIYTRLGALSLGVALSMWRHRPAYAMAEPRFLSRNRVVRAVFLVVMLWLLGTMTTNIFFDIQQVKLGLTEVLAGALVYTASFDRGYIMAAGTFRQALCWVGSRSYGLYLTHIPAYALAREIIWHVHRPAFVHDNREAAAHLLLGLALAAAFAEVSYRLIETPSRKFGRKLRVVVPTNLSTGTAPGDLRLTAPAPP